ncbi:MAG TPA: hypothetical protein VIJ19_05310 [Opitutaceae bacterium]
MPRRLALTSLLCAWLCASGAMLDMAQAVAWARMFAGYAGTESVAAAARDTFDPAKPCRLCVAVKAAREATGNSSPSAPAPALEKLVLAMEDTGYFVGQSEKGRWPDAPTSTAPSRGEAVPLPPPKSTA